MTDNLLEATKLRKEFGGLVACNDVDFVVPRGSIVSLIGPNGAGKTTFFNMLTGVYKPTSGKIMFLGEDVTGKPPHAITARGIGRIEEFPAALHRGGVDARSTGDARRDHVLIRQREPVRLNAALQIAKPLNLSGS